MGAGPSRTTGVGPLGTSGVGPSGTSGVGSSGVSRHGRFDDGWLLQLCEEVVERARLSTEVVRVPPPEPILGDYTSAIQQAEYYRHIAALREAEKAREREWCSLRNRVS